MQEQLQVIDLQEDGVKVTKYQLMHNKWDNEWGDSSAEDQRSKFGNCSIECSPTVGLWIKRRAILRWLLPRHDSKVPDSRNPVRAATRNNKIKSPLELSRDDMDARLVRCIGELFRLEKEASELRRKHLKCKGKR